MTEDDLSTVARIRYAALERFALAGYGATSFKEIAAAAGVSIGLVQHHYKTKLGLRDAVNDHVARRLADTFRVDEALETDDPARFVGDRITGLVRDERYVLLYLARAAADGDDSALGVFDALIRSADHELDRLAEAGLLRDDLDRRWTVLHIVVVNLATMLLEDAIDRQLDGSFRDPDQLERWNRATTELFRRGILKA